MPFVNVRINKGHSQERKDRISERITTAISEIAEVPKEAIWVVFEDIEKTDWYLGATTVEQLQQDQAT